MERNVEKYNLMRISRQPSPIEIMIEQNEPVKVAIFQLFE